MHNNISVFIPHIGCPHKCTFCDQRTISGAVHAPTADEAEAVIKSAYEYMSPEKRRVTEIAFFGGSFTAVPREYMLSLLAAAKKYLSPAREDGFYGIRLSTRPDCINEEILDILKENGVTAIEL
ncbi:MAG: radical SAM protein, partial [Oscillospiraceae bacterium]|nr:radical SAM protein [Oscillospiraceae bacterium]